jgi:hypothetical protein
MKIYFSQYGSYFSLSLSDALEIAETGKRGKGHNFSDYKSFKILKSKPKPSQNINKCLDWDSSDWEHFSDDLYNILNELMEKEGYKASRA